MFYLTKVYRLFELLLKWMINLYLSLFSFERNVYVFNCPYGYSDNAKYLYEYFLSHGERVVYFDKKKPFDFLLILYLLPRVKTIFVTHSIKSVFRFVPKNIIVVNLHHGIALKKSGFDSPRDLKKLDRYKYNPYEDNNYVIASSVSTISFFKSAMRLGETRILPLGQPRNDILFNSTKEKQNEIRNKLALTSGDRVILYAPTFRDGLDENINMVKSVVNTWNKYIDSKKTLQREVLILRLHPKLHTYLDCFNISMTDSIIVSSLKDDVQELLLTSDVLVSDYSSMILDYAILKRPIILAWHDYESYVCERGGFYYDLQKIFHDFNIVRRELIPSDFDKKNIQVIDNDSIINYFHKFPACEEIYERFK